MMKIFLPPNSTNPTSITMKLTSIAVIKHCAYFAKVPCKNSSTILTPKTVNKLCWKLMYLILFWHVFNLLGWYILKYLAWRAFHMLHGMTIQLMRRLLVMTYTARENFKTFWTLDQTFSVIVLAQSIWHPYFWQDSYCYIIMYLFIHVLGKIDHVLDTGIHNVEVN